MMRSTAARSFGNKAPLTEADLKRIQSGIDRKKDSTRVLNDMGVAYKAIFDMEIVVAPDTDLDIKYGLVVISGTSGIKLKCVPKGTPGAKAIPPRLLAEAFCLAWCAGGVVFSGIVDVGETKIGSEVRTWCQEHAKTRTLLLRGMVKGSMMTYWAGTGMVMDPAGVHEADRECVTLMKEIRSRALTKDELTKLHKWFMSKNATGSFMAVRSAVLTNMSDNSNTEFAAVVAKINPNSVE